MFLLHYVWLWEICCKMLHSTFGYFFILFKELERKLFYNILSKLIHAISIYPDGLLIGQWKTLPTCGQWFPKSMIQQRKLMWSQSKYDYGNKANSEIRSWVCMGYFLKSKWISFQMEPQYMSSAKRLAVIQEQHI